MRKLTILFMLFVSMLSLRAEIKTGSCGTSVTYTFDTETGVLKISGTGKMDDYGSKLDYNYSSSSYNPLQDFRDNITSVIIEEGVTHIGGRFLAGCSRLTSVSIPNSVTSIGNSAFAWCTDLTSVTIPNSVKSIEGWAFEGCSGLFSMVIPSSVTSIGNGAFAECPGISAPIMVNGIFAKLPESFVGDYTIPDDVKEIIGCAFQSCSGLTSVCIPNSVTSIGIYAFKGCSNLTSVTIPNSVTGSIGKETFCDCYCLASVTIPNSITSIEDGAFYRCHNLESITIPNSVTSIGTNAFRECNSLTSMAIPNSVTGIGSYAFQDCSSLTSVSIPNSVTDFGYRMFYNRCWPESVFWDTNIQTSCFDDYSKAQIKELIYGDNVSIVYPFFSRCTKLAKVVLGKTVSQLRTEAFKDTHITEFHITGIEPPICYPNVFQNVELDNATLYVPAEKQEYYQTTEPWSKFGSLVAEEAGMTQIEIGEKESSSFYTLDGKKVSKPSQSGVYIVKKNGQTKMIVVKK